jgi:hypothetical protein
MPLPETFDSDISVVTTEVAAKLAYYYISGNLQLFASCTNGYAFMIYSRGASLQSCQHEELTIKGGHSRLCLRFMASMVNRLIAPTPVIQGTTTATQTCAYTFMHATGPSGQ